MDTTSCGRGTPRHGGLDVGALDDNLRVVLGVGVGSQRLPVRHSLVPRLALGGHGATLEVLEGDLVGGDDTGAGASLDGHVGDGHARLHGQLLDGVTRELNDGAGTARRADDADDVKDEILAGDSLGELALDGDAHVLAGGLEEGLSGEDVLHLGRADAEGKRAKGAVGGGVRVAAHDGGAGEGETLLGADDVHDALAAVVHAEVGEAELLDVLLKGHHLHAGVGLLDEVLHGVEGGAVRGGDVVIDGDEGAVGAANFAAGGAKTLEETRTGEGEIRVSRASRRREGGAGRGTFFQRAAKG